MFSFGNATQVTPAATAERTPPTLSSIAIASAGSSPNCRSANSYAAASGLGWSTWEESTTTSKSARSMSGPSASSSAATFSGAVVVTRPTFTPGGAGLLDGVDDAGTRGGRAREALAEERGLRGVDGLRVDRLPAGLGVLGDA